MEISAGFAKSWLWTAIIWKSLSGLSALEKLFIEEESTEEFCDAKKDFYGSIEQYD